MKLLVLLLQFLLICATKLYPAPSYFPTHCRLTVRSDDLMEGGELDCNHIGSSVEDVNLQLIRVLWRDNREEIRFIGLNKKHRVRTFAPHSLRPLRGSQALQLQHLNMNSLDGAVLEPLASSLQSLRLSETQITRLYKNNFASLYLLKLLVVEDNPQLECLADGSFLGLPALKELRIERCAALHSLSAGVFQQLSTLQTLALIDTGLLTLAPHTLCPLSGLNTFEWTSQYSSLHMSCSVFAGFGQLRSLTVLQKPSVSFGERSVVHEYECVLCPLRNLKKLDGLTLTTDPISSIACPDLNLLTAECSVTIEQPATCSQPASSTIIPTPYQKSTVFISTPFKNVTLKTSVNAVKTKSNSTSIVPWFLTATAVLFIIIFLVTWYARKHPPIRRALKFLCCISKKKETRKYNFVHAQSNDCVTQRHQQKKDRVRPTSLVYQIYDEVEFDYTSGESSRTATLKRELSNSFIVIKNGQFPSFGIHLSNLSSKRNSIVIDEDDVTTNL